MNKTPTPSRYLLDEHLRGAICGHNSDPDNLPILAARVGDTSDLPLGIDDAAILRWAESEERILISCDQRTMPLHFQNHLAAGGHSPGVFLLPGWFSTRDVLEFLVLAAYAADPSEWADRIRYYP